MKVMLENNVTFKTLKVLFNTIVHMLVAIVLFVAWNMAITYFTGTFQLHILFSVTGYQLLMFEGILVFNPDTLWVNSLLRENKKIIHLSMELIGSVFAITGASLAIAAKSGAGHFNTAHGICGLIAMIFSILSVVNGAVAFFSYRRDNFLRPAVARAMHTISAGLAIIMGLVTLTIAANKLIFIELNTKGVSVCVSVFVMINLAYILTSPVKNLIQHIQNMKTTIL